MNENGFMHSRSFPFPLHEVTPISVLIWGVDPTTENIFCQCKNYV